MSKTYLLLLEILPVLIGLNHEPFESVWVTHVADACWIVRIEILLA